LRKSAKSFLWNMIKIQHRLNKMQIRLHKEKISKIFLMKISKWKTKNLIKRKNQAHFKSLQANKELTRKIWTKKIKKKVKNPLIYPIKSHWKKMKIYQTNIQTTIVLFQESETHLSIEVAHHSIKRSLYSTFILKIKTNLFRK
jgi:hypothetical protein